MNQTETTTTTNAQAVDDMEQLLSTSVLNYIQSYGGEMERVALLEVVRHNDRCRDFLSSAVNGDNYSRAFVYASGSKNHVDVLNALLDAGMNIDTKVSGGYTALMAASSVSGYDESVRLLLERNADVNLVNDNNNTALNLAAQNNLTSIAELLLEKDVNPDIQNGYGNAAIIAASRNNNFKIVEMLLQKNANPDVQDKTGLSALIFAASRNLKDIVQLLLNFNANTELKNKHGQTALKVTTSEEVKEMLLNHVHHNSSQYVLK